MNDEIGDIGDAGREFLARLAMGDKGAERLQEIHELSVESAARLIQVAAEHYRACLEADFWRAEETATIAQKGIEQIVLAHRIVIRKGEI